MHPGIHKDSLIDYCLEHQIQIESYSPLGRTKILSEPVLLNLSERYGKSPAQIVLRWQLEKGYLPLPRSSNTMRMKQNIEIFDFILTAEEIKTIDDIAYENITELDDNPDIIDF